MTLNVSRPQALLRFGCIDGLNQSVLPHTLFVITALTGHTRKTLPTTFVLAPTSSERLSTDTAPKTLKR